MVIASIALLAMDSFLFSKTVLMEGQLHEIKK
jgi:hypothetical protein